MLLPCRVLETLLLFRVPCGSLAVPPTSLLLTNLRPLGPSCPLLFLCLLLPLRLGALLLLLGLLLPLWLGTLLLLLGLRLSL
jgi:hypothetical protein